jgi:hypothetical protein
MSESDLTPLRDLLPELLAGRPLVVLTGAAALERERGAA